MDAVGFPYNGACTTLNTSKLYIRDLFVVDDVFIENRTPGKLLYKNEKAIVIVCDSDLLNVQDFYDEKG